MLCSLDALEVEISRNSSLLDALFEQEFTLAELLKGADAAGFEIGEDELIGLEALDRRADVHSTIRFKMLAPLSSDPKELSDSELDLVVGGVALHAEPALSYPVTVNTFTHTNTNVTVSGLAVAIVFAVLIVLTFTV